MNYAQLKNLIDQDEHNKVVLQVMKIYNPKFKIILNKYRWKYINTVLEDSDILTVFMFEIPKIVQSFSPEKGATFETYIRNEFKNIIFKYTRRYTKERYKVLNQYIEYEEGKYSMPNLFQIPKLNYSVLTEFEHSVFLSIFEANKTIPQTAIEHEVSDYKIRSTILDIKLKLKKQL